MSKRIIKERLGDWISRVSERIMEELAEKMKRVMALEKQYE